jgi:NAD+ diphosphatase
MTAPAPNTFAGATLDRAGHLRADPSRTAALRADPRARAVVVVREGALVQGDVGTFGADAWDRPTGAVRAVRLPLPAAGGEQAPFLGLGAGGAPLFALDVLPGGAPPPGTELLNLRAAAAILPAQDAGLLGYAAGLLHWHRATRFCGKCGRPTEAGEAGHVRRCERGHAHHPRTDPVVIMLVTDGDRVLLGRQAVWPQHRYSALAGFVEPGEALEEAVAREVLEEAGVTVTGVRYASSQPWPFPASLMLGFEARYAGGDATPLDGELEDVAWFTRDEVAVAARGDGTGPLLLPPPLAIARRLVDAWIGC